MLISLTQPFSRMEGFLSCWKMEFVRVWFLPSIYVYESLLTCWYLAVHMGVHILFLIDMGFFSDLTRSLDILLG